MTALLGLATRLKLAKLMLITGARAQHGDLAGLAQAAFGSGVDLIQLRDPQAPMAAQAAALAVLEKFAGHRGLVSAYGSAEVAAALRADVVQLSALDGPASAAHSALGQWALVGRSCHSPGQVDDAVADPEVDFFTLSPVFNAGGVGEAGLGLVRYAAQVAPPATSKPWFAVGGVSLATLDDVLAAGARRVGVTRAVTSAPDREAAAATFAARLAAAWNDDPGLTQSVFDALA